MKVIKKAYIAPESEVIFFATAEAQMGEWISVHEDPDPDPFDPNGKGNDFEDEDDLGPGGGQNQWDINQDNDYERSWHIRTRTQ